MTLNNIVQSLMFVEVTQQTNVPSTTTIVTEAITVPSSLNLTSAVGGSVMGAVIFILCVVIVVLVRKIRLYIYILFHS